VTPYFRNHGDQSRRRARSRPIGGAAPSARDLEEQPVRFTLDLPRRQHRFLKRFALDSEVEASVVLRGLLELLQNDPQIAQRLRPLLPEMRARSRART
jgi:hypothetical protein